MGYAQINGEFSGSEGVHEEWIAGFEAQIHLWNCPLLIQTTVPAPWNDPNGLFVDWLLVDTGCIDPDWKRFTEFMDGSASGYQPFGSACA
jgi:hypothetical protein